MPISSASHTPPGGAADFPDTPVAPASTHPVDAGALTPRRAARPRERFDAVVVGAGPNGFAAAITLAEAGWKVLLLEAAPTYGGGVRTEELTLPGFLHDRCSAIHPLAVASPFFRRQPLEEFGLEWCHPEVQLAHPLDDGTAAALYRDLDRTAAGLDADAARYRALFAPLTRHATALLDDVLAPLHLPRHPLILSRFGLQALRSARGWAQAAFAGAPARALFAGNAAHSVLPLDAPLSAATGLLLTLSAHAYGWPVARGGSGSIARALAERLVSLGGVVQTGCRVRRLADMPQANALLFDVSPGALAEIAAGALPERYLAGLQGFRHGPAAFKLDFALSGPIPWTAAVCRQAGTVHVGGTLEEIADAERAPWENRMHARPFVLVGQQSIVDPSRAPAGKHTGWAYCHVPNGSAFDATEAIEAQIERFAPGFRQLILAKRVTQPAAFFAYNANYVGGDIVGGVQDLRQLFTRPVLRANPYTTPHAQVFLCSASTPPGAGVHGMCGFHAARAVLRRIQPAITSRAR